jgi:ComF family protein
MARLLARFAERRNRADGYARIDFSACDVLRSLALKILGRMQALFSQSLLARSMRVALDAVVPPLCLNCQSAVAEPGALCASCWSRFAWIDRPYCETCGLPFDYDPGFLGRTGLACGACLSAPPPFGKARAVLRYDAASRGLLLAFKHADRTHAAPAFARWLARAGRDVLDGADLIAPVPLHWTRLAMRRFNQAALLANALSGLTGIPSVPDLLRRQRRTRTQGTLGRGERLRNVRRAFALSKRHRSRVRGKIVVLVDDVLTTGATLGECARALRRAGAAEIRTVTVARVVRPGEGRG